MIVAVHARELSGDDRRTLWFQFSMPARVHPGTLAAILEELGATEISSGIGPVVELERGV